MTELITYYKDISAYLIFKVLSQNSFFNDLYEAYNT